VLNAQELQMKFLHTSFSLLTLFAVVSISACSSDSNNDPLNDPADLPPLGAEGEPIGVFNPDATTKLGITQIFVVRMLAKSLIHRLQILQIPARGMQHFKFAERMQEREILTLAQYLQLTPTS